MHRLISQKKKCCCLSYEVAIIIHNRLYRYLYGLFKFDINLKLSLLYSFLCLQEMTDLTNMSASFTTLANGDASTAFAAMDGIVRE